VNVSCPECRSVFRVDPARVSSAGVRARCSICGAVMTVGVGASIDEEFAPSQAASQSASAATLVAVPVAAAATVPAPVAVAPAAARPAPFPPRPVAPARPGSKPAMATPPRGGFAVRPTMPPIPAIPPLRPMPPIRPTTSPSMPAVPPPLAVQPPQQASAPAPARAPINPFLANDPNAKARRLSRALISDLVTYFPQRRDEGLRDGTLKELFREEIKKSYEEYVDQVGREFADSTTHFQEALNEILAGGQKMF
jgi:predicted Zn finger-like uncharacterized protein